MFWQLNYCVFDIVTTMFQLIHTSAFNRCIFKKEKLFFIFQPFLEVRFWPLKWLYTKETEESKTFQLILSRKNNCLRFLLHCLKSEASNFCMNPVIRGNYFHNLKWLIDRKRMKFMLILFLDESYINYGL